MERRKQLLVELREQRAKQRRIEPDIEVEVQVEMERRTRRLMQVSMQLAELRPVLPDEHREVLRGEE